jgi:peptidoglycan/xylan/chitin deacetylase (PgdA/CDA1 family)
VSNSIQTVFFAAVVAAAAGVLLLWPNELPGAATASARLAPLPPAYYWDEGGPGTFSKMEQWVLLKAGADRPARKIVRGSPFRRRIALTFDDGPHPETSYRVLNILRSHRAKATFFVTGEMAERYPEVVKAEAAAGHSVANHTYRHVRLTELPIQSMACELRACGTVIERITGKAPRLFRPPGGDSDERVMGVAEYLGYTTVFWTCNPGDWTRPTTETIADRVLSRAHNGGIVLLHDGVRQTSLALPRILDELEERGFEFVTVDELLRDQNPAPATHVARLLGRSLFTGAAARWTAPRPTPRPRLTRRA